MLTVSEGKTDRDLISRFDHSTKYAQEFVNLKLANIPLRNGIDICKGELGKRLIDCALSAWGNDEIRGFHLKLLNLLSTHPAELNTDDTDMIQHGLAALRKMIEINPKIVEIIVPDQSVAKKIMELLLSILRVHKKMVNLIQYLVDILSTYIDCSERAASSEERVLFRSIIEVGFRENKENSDVMKELIRVAPRFCSE